MVYKIISVVCDEINKGFSIGYVELQNHGGKWECDNFIKSNFDYTNEWKQKLTGLTDISISDYISRNNKFGIYLSGIIKEFVAINNFEFKVQLIALKGFPVLVDKILADELGSPSQVAALTSINVVADFNGINTALHGNGNYLHSVAAELFAGQESEIQFALLAVLRWREENNFLAENTGAKRNSIGGAVWMGQEA